MHCQYVGYFWVEWLQELCRQWHYICLSRFPYYIGHLEGMWKCDSFIHVRCRRWTGAMFGVQPDVEGGTRDSTMRQGTKKTGVNTLGQIELKLTLTAWSEMHSGMSTTFTTTLLMGIMENLRTAWTRKAMMKLTKWTWRTCWGSQLRKIFKAVVWTVCSALLFSFPFAAFTLSRIPF